MTVPDTQNQESVKAYLEKINETIRKSEELLAVAREKIAETDRLHEALGLTREEVYRQLHDPGLPQEVKDKIREIEAEFDRQLSVEEAVENYSPEKEQEHREEQLGSLTHGIRL